MAEVSETFSIYPISVNGSVLWSMHFGQSEHSILSSCSVRETAAHRIHNKERLKHPHCFDPLSLPTKLQRTDHRRIWVYYYLVLYSGVCRGECVYSWFLVENFFGRSEFYMTDRILSPSGWNICGLFTGLYFSYLS